jgi:hypothetical protein
MASPVFMRWPLVKNLTRLIELISELKDLDIVSFEKYVGNTEMLELKKNKGA